MEEAFVNHLLAGTALAALVGERIAWTKRGATLPAIVLHRISGAPLYSDEGQGQLASARIQVDIWAKDVGTDSGYLIAKRVAREVMARLSGGGARFASDNFTFSGAFLEDEQDSFERGTGAEALNRVRQDYIIWYKET